MGTTWNATAELFINTGDNSARLDPVLFVPVCTVDARSMQRVLAFPSVGEVAELGGDGVSLDALYAEGNAYVAANPAWQAMAQTTAARVFCGVEPVGGIPDASFSRTCGPCTTGRLAANPSQGALSVAYAGFAAGAWVCPGELVDTCALSMSNRGSQAPRSQGA
jgi:hypothetical protein